MLLPAWPAYVDFACAQHLCHLVVGPALHNLPYRGRGRVGQGRAGGQGSRAELVGELSAGRVSAGGIRWSRGSAGVEDQHEKEECAMHVRGCVPACQRPPPPCPALPLCTPFRPETGDSPAR